MRIIAGTYRGRRLKAPRGRSIRPTADRVRETIFNIIGHDIRDHNVVDVCAGTGAMGIEALSRGAAHVVFIDKHPRAIACVRTNVAPLGADDRWQTIRWDAGSDLRCLRASKMRFRYAFIDPPYNRGLADRVLRNLIEADVLLADSLIVVEHDHLETIAPPHERIALQDQRRCGKTLVTFLRTML
ncbi:MAG: 16S rRNA (guanine(966)-N(2))-methyltransferase RsmD [Desulfobacterales bacterium]|nr:16S rRNA (guanine(966)-N(2))-methyltransferase RsmD [Desulfobacterales bacterium]